MMRAMLILIGTFAMLPTLYSQPKKVQFDAKDLKHCEESESPEQVLSSCTRLISAGLPFSSIYHSRGKVYSAAHDYARAISDFDEAIRLDQGHIAALYARAWAHHDIG